jgi:cell shape-determining protein MreC
MSLLNRNYSVSNASLLSNVKARETELEQVKDENRKLREMISVADNNALIKA